MEKNLTVYIRLKAPAEANIFVFIEKLRSFLDEAETLGEVDCDFSTLLPADAFAMRR